MSDVFEPEEGAAVSSSGEAEVRAQVPMTVTVNLGELLDAYIGEIPAYTGDPDDEYEPPSPVAGALINAAAHLMVRQVKEDADGYTAMVNRIREKISQAIEGVVADELVKPYLPVDSYGEPRRGAEPTTLREQIGKQASEMMAKGMVGSNRYDNTPAGVVKEFIDKEIRQLVQGELKQALDQAKAQVLDQVKDQAAQVITDLVARNAVR